MLFSCLPKLGILLIWYVHFIDPICIYIYIIWLCNACRRYNLSGWFVGSVFLMSSLFLFGLMIPLRWDLSRSLDHQPVCSLNSLSHLGGSRGGSPDHFTPCCCFLPVFLIIVVWYFHLRVWPRSSGAGWLSHHHKRIWRMALCYREVEDDTGALQVFDYMIRQVNVIWLSNPLRGRLGWMVSGCTRSTHVKTESPSIKWQFEYRSTIILHLRLLSFLLPASQI